MGRRGKRRTIHQDDNDELERAWMEKRQRVVGNSEQEHEDRKSTGQDDRNDSKERASGEEHKKNDAADDKIERLRLKKQRQKERRKEKKAAARAIKQQEEANRGKQKKLAEMVRKDIKEKHRKLKEKSGNFQTLRMGVKCVDIIVGEGPPVKDRKKVRVRYMLRSKSHFSGKIIDSSSNFGFRLGKGEVIRGWDIGMEGMRVGGTRRLIVPPAAGYGNKDIGAGRGADLYFEIELLHVAP